MSGFYSQHDIVEFYQKQATPSEYHLPQAVGWHNSETQKIRFFIFSQIADLSDKSILDVGCGPGAFYPFLQECFSNVSYTGMDLNVGFIEYAKNLHTQATWITADFLEHNFQAQQFDFVFASGAVAIKVADNQKFVEGMIRKMFALCKTGMAINMLSDFAPQKLAQESLQYYSPNEIFNFCKSLSEYVTLRHDYLKNDFTVYLFKD